MAAAPAWRPTRRNDAFDVALAAVMTVGGGLSLYIAADENLYGELADYPLGWALLGVTGLVAPLAVRRRYPLTAAVVGSVAYLPMILCEVPESYVAPISFFILLYSAGAYGGPRRNPVRALGVAVIIGLVMWQLANPPVDYPGTVGIELVNALTTMVNVFYLAAAWMLGDLVRSRREREATLVARTQALRAAQAERARQAVREEQLRIARELHDVIAHHVSVMGVQAGAARRVLERRPESVPELLASVEEASRQAVAELQRMLRLLREDDDAEADRGTAPQPTLARLGALVEQMRDAGLTLQADLAGVAGPLPPSVDLSAFRIVQEALTNVLKHAGPGTSTSVQVTRRAGSLEVVVRDDGPPPGRPPASARSLAVRVRPDRPAVVTTPGSPDARSPDGGSPDDHHVDTGGLDTGRFGNGGFGVDALTGGALPAGTPGEPATGPAGAGAAAGAWSRVPLPGGGPGGTNGGNGGTGLGLVGMRERVTLLGGELRAGRRRGGGFEVRAWLPLARDHGGPREAAGP